MAENMGPLKYLVLQETITFLNYYQSPGRQWPEFPHWSKNCALLFAGSERLSPLTQVTCFVREKKGSTRCTQMWDNMICKDIEET